VTDIADQSTFLTELNTRMTQHAEQPDAPQQDSAASAEAKAPAPAMRVMPAFSEDRMQRQLTYDKACIWGAFVLFLVVLVVASVMESMAYSPGVTLSTFAMLAYGGAWFWFGARNARVWRSLREITAMLDAQPERAEHLIAEAFALRLLHRPLRALLYHRLAAVRHRQRRFEETAAIADALLRLNPKGVAGVRSHLLLMLVDACLEFNQLTGAWYGLVELSRMPLRLVESLQCRALRVKYELATGYWGQTLRDLPQTVEMAELLPAPQCGALHAMLAEAAARGHRHAESVWLRKRAELLCHPDQLATLQRQGLWIAPTPPAEPS